ncbi:hypothetical protein Bealeia1_00119 [Candidatus Bealeia paramacronuclearis]|uniref:Uncharacterized protein n=1 Tax=Candidatus Bealeia paramacronuclearis TaxID=1921001 RepID=A0ABZ2C2L9_9PROT|nr:hypothetical protein [Candidatus Bealeia paramacronuclearis]
MLLNLVLVLSLFSFPAFCGKNKENQKIYSTSSKKQKVVPSKEMIQLKNIDWTQSPLGFIRAIKAELTSANKEGVMNFYRPFLSSNLAEVIKNSEGVQKSDHIFLIELIDMKLKSIEKFPYFDALVYGQDFKLKLELARKKFSEDDISSKEEIQ